MIKFEKVSYEQFEKDSLALGYTPTREIYDNIKLPKRGTTGSAGYDFHTPYPINLSINKTQTIPTGIRVALPQNLVLIGFPRSGLGFKNGMHFANTNSIIDSDYYYSQNEGHIMSKICMGFDKCKLNAGDRFMQGIIMQYFVTDDDNTTETRNGGFGSTGAR